MNSSPSSTPDTRPLDASLGRYALAATAALSAAASAEAAITNFTSTGSFSLSGINDFQSFNFSEAGISINFSGRRSSFTSTSTNTNFITTSDPGPGYTTTNFSTFTTYTGRIEASENTTIRFFTTGDFSGDAVNFSPGAAISGDFSRNFVQLFATFSFSGYGAFSPPTGDSLTGYLGFRATIGSEDYLGWLRVEISRAPDGRPDGFSLVPVEGITGAFAPVSEGITAGQTAIPEPAAAATGLGLLALGAAGLRRRRALATARN